MEEIEETLDEIKDIQDTFNTLRSEYTKQLRLLIIIDIVVLLLLLTTLFIILGD